jgi:hypothetical protein
MRFFAICLCGAILLAGCSGPERVEAKGRIVSGGQPLKFGPQGALQVVLVPKGKEQSIDLTTFTADVDKEQGTFSVFGGVPPGTYKIVIAAYDPYPSHDKLNGKFSMEKSPILREVTGEPLEIDIASP